MDVRLTRKMFEVLGATPELPANLAAKLKSATGNDDGVVLAIDEEERMAMEEMCQWYVLKDPETGKLNEKGIVYEAIIDAIYDADIG